MSVSLLPPTDSFRDTALRALPSIETVSFASYTSAYDFSTLARRLF
jgi:hypothetical protein